jgi:hypothetical protein
MNFEPITLDDREWVQTLTRADATKNADFSFVNLFSWSSVYEFKLAKGGGYMVVQMTADNGCRCFSFPLGADDNEVVQILTELQKLNAEQNIPALTLVGVSREQLDTLLRLYGNRVTFEPQTDMFDYLYDVQKLASLAGKKLHAKRNYVNRFLNTYPDYVFEPVTPDNVAECLMTDGIWLYNKADEGFDTIPGEIAALERSLTNFAALGLDGGLLRLRKCGTVVAFAVGERLSSDVYVTHFEKALPDIEGAYQVINKEFASYILGKFPDVKYINREEDMGIDNLRKAKRSYYPDLMEEKLKVVIAD